MLIWGWPCPLSTPEWGSGVTQGHWRALDHQVTHCPPLTAALLLSHDEILTARARHPHRTPGSAGRAPGLAGQGHAGREGGRGGHRPGVRVGRGHTDRGVSVMSRGANSPPCPPLPCPPKPPPLLQALGQLCLVADGAGPAVQAVIVTGQAARGYLPIRAAVGHRGSAPWALPAVLCPPRCSVLPSSPSGLGCWLIPPTQLMAGTPGWALGRH